MAWDGGRLLRNKNQNSGLLCLGTKTKLTLRSLKSSGGGLDVRGSVSFLGVMQVTGTGRMGMSLPVLIVALLSPGGGAVSDRTLGVLKCGFDHGVSRCCHFRGILSI